MATQFRITSICLIVLAVNAAGRAQEREQPLPEPRVATGLPSRPLLDEPVVQREIRLTEKQKANLALLQEDYQANRGGAGADVGGEGFDFTAMMNQTEELDRRYQAAVAKLLTATQRNRLLQIDCQREGWVALGRPEIAKRVNLAPSQEQKIREITEMMRRDQVMASFGAVDETQAAQAAAAVKGLNPANGFLGDPEAVIAGGGPIPAGPAAGPARVKQADAGSARVRSDAARAVADLLKTEQRAAFDRLLGPPFDFKLIDEPTAPAPSPRRPVRSTKSKVKTP